MRRRAPRIASAIRARARRFDPYRVEAPVHITEVAVAPHGFGAFDATTHPALLAIAERATEELFRHFGLNWIPGEFRDMQENRSPIDAMEEFCRSYGIPFAALGRSNPDAIERLHQVVGILVEVGLMRDVLPDVNLTHITSALRKADFDLAESLVTTFQLAVSLLRAFRTLEPTIVFREYRAFVAEVRSYATDLSQFTRTEIADAVTANEEYKTLQQEFDLLNASLDELITWLEDNWPDNAWGITNEPIATGIANAKDALADRLRSDDTLNPFDGVDQLREIKDDLLAFVDEVRKASGTDWSGGTYEDPFELRMHAWRDALVTLGFSEDANPNETEIKKAYRPPLFEHHSDHWGHADEKTQAEHAEQFAIYANAKDVLLKRKPKK